MEGRNYSLIGELACGQVHIGSILLEDAAKQQDDKLHPENNMKEQLLPVLQVVVPPTTQVVETFINRTHSIAEELIWRI